jgi:hypothetical protein
MITAVDLVIYVFVMFGLAYIVGHSVISRPLREWLAKWHTAGWLLTLIECPACFGFWEGVVAALLILTPGLIGDVFFMNVIAWALFTSGSNFLLAKLTGLM